MFRSRRSALVGLLAALAVVVLAGCGPTSTPAASAPAAPPPTSSAAPTSTTATTTAAAAPDKGKCLLTDVHPEVTQTTGEAGQRHTTVTWTNVSSSTCTMFGYGGVDLKGPPDPQTDTYSLPRQTSEQPALVRLAPGDKAHTVITWLPSDTTRWTPTKLLVTPPDETHSAVLDWPGGAVTRQDGATHPGTYVGPVEKGATA
jgi:hypothetical protein